MVYAELIILRYWCKIVIQSTLKEYEFRPVWIYLTFGKQKTKQTNKTLQYPFFFKLMICWPIPLHWDVSWDSCDFSISKGNLLFIRTIDYIPLNKIIIFRWTSWPIFIIKNVYPLFYMWSNMIECWMIYNNFCLKSKFTEIRKYMKGKWLQINIHLNE